MQMPEYLAIKAFSSGLANKLLMESPMHARYAFDNPADDSSTAADIGTAIHAALLEGDDVIARIEADLYPAKNGNLPEGWTNPAIRAAREEARAAGKVPLLPWDADRVAEALVAVREQLADTELADAFNLGEPERTWTWDEDGALCKIRPDWISSRWHISVKTTDGSARPDAWIRRQLGPMGIDTQLAFYERGLRTMGWDGQSRLLVVEQNPPYRIVVIGLAPSRQAYAEARADRAIAIWADCLRRNRWPGYSTQTHFAEILPFEQAQEEEAQLGGAFDPEIAGQG